MSKNNVKVTVKLVDGFSRQLKKLDSQLDKISAKQVTPRFDFDDNGQIDRVKGQLASIDEAVHTKLNILGKPALKETQASVKSLSGIENVYVRVHDQELTQAIAKQRALRAKRRARTKVRAQNEFLGSVQNFTQRSSQAEGSFDRARQARERAQPFTRRMGRQLLLNRARLQNGQRTAARVRGLTPEMRSLPGSRRGGVLDQIGNSVKSFFGRGGKGKYDRSPADRLSGNLLRLIPRGQLSQDLAAFFMPFMFTMYTAAMGAFAAALAPAIAGIGALSLGILGFGENAADSLKLAEVRLRIFGRELHKVFKPVQQTFAPFVDQWFTTLPHSLARELSMPLQNMVVWMPTVEQIGSGLLGWTRDLLNLMNDLEPIISRVVMQLGADTGDALLRFFEWLILELDTNYTLIQDTLGAFKELAIFVYRVSILWTQAIANLSPLISGLGKFINMVASSPVLGTIVAWGMSLAIVGGVLIKIIGLFVALSGFLVGGFLGSVVASLGTAIAMTKAWFLALSAAAKMAVIATGGLALIGGGIALAAGAGMFSSPDTDSFSRGGGTGQAGRTNVGGNTINIYGNPDNTQVQQFKDMFPAEHRTETNINSRMTQG